MQFDEEAVTRSHITNCRSAAPSIWGNPTVMCAGSNAGVQSLQDNMEMLEVLSNHSVRIRYHEETYVEPPQESSPKISEIGLLRLNQKV